MPDARDLNFRYYLKHKTADKWAILEFSLKEIEESDGITVHPHFEIVAVVQSTGMIDSNGYYIFEDDIVTDGEETQGIIKWNENSFRWQVYDDYNNDGLDEFTNTGLEILGNIHQNPELK